MPNDVAKIRSVVRQYIAACHADDIDALAKTLANDMVFMPPNAPKSVGKKAVLAATKAGFFDPFKIKLKVKNDRVQVFGSQAVASGSFANELTPKSGGDPVKGVGKQMAVFRKQRDGSWKYAQLIFNYDKPPA
jgi:uncharacterized protein (TIGR02246 family)